MSWRGQRRSSRHPPCRPPARFGGQQIASAYATWPCHGIARPRPPSSLEVPLPGRLLLAFPIARRLVWTRPQRDAGGGEAHDHRHWARPCVRPDLYSDHALPGAAAACQLHAAHAAPRSGEGGAPQSGWSPPKTSLRTTRRCRHQGWPAAPAAHSTPLPPRGSNRGPSPARRRRRPSPRAAGTASRGVGGQHPSGGEQAHCTHAPELRASLPRVALAVTPARPAPAPAQAVRECPACALPF